MNNGIIFAILASLSLGIWTFFHKLAGNLVNPLFGGIFVSLVGTIMGIIFLIPQLGKIELYSDKKGLLYLLFAGIAAISIDYFAIKAYSFGSTLNITGPIIIGGSILFTALLGIFIGETLTITKILGILFLVFGGILLSFRN